MVRHPLARVVQHNLRILLAETGRDVSSILVGTDAWYAWLNAAETRSFSYETEQGRVTVRRELRQHGWYWYAYRTCQGKLRKVYLGKAENLSPQHLAEACHRLSEPRDTPAHASVRSPLLPSQPALLTAKLIPPALPDPLVNRPHLCHLLQKAMTQPLTLVCAPAGFGKTTLVREWMAQGERSCAWLSLDREDNDPRHFLTALVAALQQIQPDFGSTLLALLSSFSPSAPSETLALLLNALCALSTTITLILDNYHVIVNQHIHDALAFVLEHLPPQLHLLLLSRSTPPFPYARLRASGKVSEIRAEDLRFTPAESEHFLLARMHLTMKAADVALLAERTEGWIAGLHLGALVLREGGDRTPGVTTFAGIYREVLAYVREEILAPQSEDIQTFLLASSLLEHCHAALCDAVMGREHTASLLEQVAQTNLLLFPCAEHPRCYRLPQLWAEALRHHLKLMQPELALTFHMRASRWFEEQGMSEQAIAHALAAHDEERAGWLLERAAPHWLERGEITTLHHWLDTLPDAVVRANPRLCISQAWLTFITTQAHLFLAWIEAAERALQNVQATLSSPLVNTLRAEIVGLRAFYQSSYDESANAIVACNQALLLLPEENWYPWGLLLVALGFAYTRGMSANAGSQALSQARSVLQTRGHALLFPYVLVGQVEISLAQGSPTQAAHFCRQILALTVEQNVPAVLSAALAHVGLGRVFGEWKNLDMARSHLLQAWDLATQTQTFHTLFLSSLLLIQLAQAEKDAQEEAYWLQQMEKLGRNLEQTVIPDFVLALRARRSLSDGDVEAALFWARNYQVASAKPDRRYDEWRRFTQVRILLAARRAFGDETCVQQALTVLERVKADAEEVGNVRVLIEALMLQALALQLIGEQADALTVLAHAVALAEPGRYIQLFVGEGDPLVRLLRHLFEQQRARKASERTLSLPYLSRLLKAFAAPMLSSLPTSARSGEPLLDPLSVREHEVLRLLASGRKNREIADELVVVTGTVKAHINTIYQKLGVNSRVQAIERARSLGLL